MEIDFKSISGSFCTVYKSFTGIVVAPVRHKEKVPPPQKKMAKKGKNRVCAGIFARSAPNFLGHLSPSPHFLGLPSPPPLKFF